MQVGKKNLVKSCKRDDVYKYYFNIINGLLGLSPKEVDIVARLYHYNGIISKAVTEPKLAGTLLFSRDYKGKIVKDLGIKPLLLNNYIANLKKKGIILVDEDGLKWLNPIHTLETDKDGLQIVFNLKIEDNEGEPRQQPEPQEERAEEPEEQIEEEEDFTLPESKEPEFNPEDPWGTGANV